MKDLNHGGMKLTNSWITDKDYADGYIPAIREVISKVADKIVKVEIASTDEDQQYATDYIVTLDTGKVACRVRRSNCGFRDLTIRAWRASGQTTELTKIREGFARWYLYAWAQDDNTFKEWIFIDINRMRETGLIYHDRQITKNPDNTTGFVSYSIPELLYHNCLVKRG